MWWKHAIKNYVIPANSGLHPDSLDKNFEYQAKTLAGETLESKLEKQRVTKSDPLFNSGMQALEGAQGYQLIRGVPQSWVSQSLPDSLQTPMNPSA